MGTSKQNKLWKNIILPLIGTGGIGAIVIAFLNHNGGHNVATGNISGNVAIGDHATIQIGSISNQSNLDSKIAVLTPKQIGDEVVSARPFQKDDIINSLKGASVDWVLPLAVIDKGTFSSQVGLGSQPEVRCAVPNSQLAVLQLLTNGSPVRVRGTIEDVIYSEVIFVKNATITVP
jgi:hypothetical protein